MTADGLERLTNSLDENFKTAFKSRKRPIDSCIRLAVLATQVEHLNGVAADMRKRFDKLEAKQNRTLALLNAVADVLIKRFGE